MRIERMLTSQVLRRNPGVFGPVMVGAYACQASRQVEGGLAQLSCSPFKSQCF